MAKEQKFYKALQDVFIGAKIEGTGGFVNLMKIKSKLESKKANEKRSVIFELDRIQEDNTIVFKVS